MQIEPFIWAAIILAGTCIWFVLDLQKPTTKYHVHKKLYNAENKTWIRPMDVVDMGRVIEQPEEYLNSTNAIRRLYDHIAVSTMFDAAPFDQEYDRREDALVAGQPKSNVTKCMEQTNWIVQQVKMRNNFYEFAGQDAFELTNFMDTFGRPNAGIFADYNDAWIGLHEKCQAASLRKGEIRGRYCLSRFRFADWPGQPSRIAPEPALRIGVCLPEACDSLSIESPDLNDTISWLAKFQIERRLRDRIELRTLFCLPDEESPLRQMTKQGKIFSIVLLSWLALFLFINCSYELYFRRKSKNDGSLTYIRLMKGFTLRNSVKSFTLRQENPVDRPVNTTMLQFVRFIMAFAIVIAHSGAISKLKTRNRRGGIELGISNSAKFFMSFIRLVDTFLILFGLTMSYTLLGKFRLEKLKNPKIWLLTNLIIYLRIAPMHALILNFNKLIAPLLGSGPWWDYGMNADSPRFSCYKSSWLESIPFFANWNIHSVPFCNPPAWFLAVYFQIAPIIPLLTYVIATLPSRTFGLGLIGSISLLSSANVSWKLYNQRAVSPELIGDYAALMALIVERYETTGYLHTIGRFGTVAIGVYAGYLLHLYQTGKIKRWPAWFSSKLFNFSIISVHIALLLIPVLLKPILSPNERISMTMFQLSAINFVLTPLWPTINCILILNACTTYKNHIAVRFMAHPFWIAAGKLALLIYLVHSEILMILLTINDSAPGNGSNTDIFRLVCFALIVTLAIAIFLYIIFEAPLTYIQAKFILPALQGSHEISHSKELQLNSDGSKCSHLNTAMNNDQNLVNENNMGQQSTPLNHIQLTDRLAQ